VISGLSRLHLPRRSSNFAILRDPSPRKYGDRKQKWKERGREMNEPIRFSRAWADYEERALTKDVAFNRHSLNDGSHNSPFNSGKVDIGTDEIKVRLVQGIDEAAFREVLGRATLATTGLDPDEPRDELPWEEMLRGGLQGVLESQVIVFEVAGISRALTHQLVRTRKAAFHQQSQRATFMGTRPDARMPESVWRNYRARMAFVKALDATREAYRIACEEGDISYQDARYILPEGSETYILCEYSVREFMNMYSYRGCSMFLWEHVSVVREMRRILVEEYPWLDPYVRISCQTSETCELCDGTGIIDDDEGPPFTCGLCGGGGKLGGKCTFQGWENVEGQCDFPWARQDNRVFLPDPKLAIGEKK
jgi:flavin-dependent thymidylate synthase